MLLTVAPRLAVGALPAPTAGLQSSILAAVVHAGLAEKLVMVVLVAFSAASWAVIAHKTAVLGRARRQSRRFLDAFWASKRLDMIYQKSEEYPDSPVSQVFRSGYVELAKLKKTRGEQAKIGDGDGQDIASVERSMSRAQAAQLSELEGQVSFLGTCGSTAPFIGLFGTVIGIINAFAEIGAAGNANIATVAPGIGGALVATAFGLLAAIPAVMAYNYFLARVRTLEVDMQNFSADFLNIVKRHFF